MKCEHCPCKHLPYGCPSYTAPHPVYCDLARESAEYREVIERMAVEDALPEDYTPPKTAAVDTSRAASVVILAGKTPDPGMAVAIRTLVKSFYDTHAYASGVAIAREYDEDSLTDADRLSLSVLMPFIQVVYGKQAASSLIVSADAVAIVDSADASDVFLDSHTNNPIVFSLLDRGVDPSDPSAYIAANEKLTDVYIASTAAASSASLSSRRVNVRIIPRGVDPTRCSIVDKATARIMLGLPLDKTIVGYIGEASSTSNVEALIDAVQFLPEQFVAAVFGGEDGAYLESLQARADEKAPGRVGFLPWRYDVGIYMSSIDTLIRPSSRGGFGSPVVEAWLCGKPVISTEVGIASEQKRFVKIMPKTNLGEIVARCILDDAVDPNRDARIAAAAEAAELEYTIGKTGGMWSDMIRTAVESRRNPRGEVEIRRRPPDPRRHYLAQKAVDKCIWRGSLPECACRNKFSCALGKGLVKPGVVAIEECLECKSSEEASRNFALADDFPSPARVSIVVEAWSDKAARFAEMISRHWDSTEFVFGNVIPKAGESFLRFDAQNPEASFADVMIYYDTTPSQTMLDLQPTRTVNVLVVDNPLVAKAEASAAFWADLVVATNSDASDRIGTDTTVAVIYNGVDPSGEPATLDFPEGSLVVSACGIESCMALADALECSEPNVVGAVFGVGSGCIDAIRTMQDRLGDRIRFVQDRDVAGVVGASDVHLSVGAARGFDEGVASAWRQSIPVVATPGGIVDPDRDVVHILPEGWTAEGISDAILQAAEETQGNRLRLLRAKKYVCDQMTPQRCVRRWAETIGRLIQSGRASQSS